MTRLSRKQTDPPKNRRRKRMGALFGVACAGLAGLAAPVLAAPSASATQVGTVAAVDDAPAPLRTCPDEGCGVIVYMPHTTNFAPGGGWVTIVWANNVNSFCEVNWKGDIGWTGCWRLGIPE